MFSNTFYQNTFSDVTIVSSLLSTDMKSFMESLHEGSKIIHDIQVVLFCIVSDQKGGCTYSGALKTGSSCFARAA